MDQVLIDFQNKFINEEECQKHLFKARWPNGYKCPRCTHDQFYFHQNRQLYRCKECGYQVSLTAGTIFHKTKTPLFTWFWIIFFMHLDDNNISIAALQRAFKFKNYKTMRAIHHKILKVYDDKRGLNYLILKSIP